MHIDKLEQWQHSHDFSSNYAQAERTTKQVMLLTAVTMMVEIGAGSLFGSMALLSDGWHMATHVAAFGITLFTYDYARRHANSPRYSFGTGKVSVLGGFASAIALAVVAFVMALESGMRLLHPQVIQFNEAVAVATLGLVINLISGIMLHKHHGHDHAGHGHHGHEHSGHEHYGHEHFGHEHFGHEHSGHEHHGHEHSGHEHSGHHHAGHGHEHYEPEHQEHPGHEHHRQGHLHSSHHELHSHQESEHQEPGHHHPKHHGQSHYEHGHQDSRQEPALHLHHEQSHRQELEELGSAAFEQHEQAGHQDHNLRAAYFHVLADALTSVFAITALLMGKFWGWNWMDPIMGMVGAVVITRWAYGLVQDTSAILLDGSAPTPVQAAIRAAIEADADNRITDLHVWSLGSGHLAATVSLVTHYPQAPTHYKALPGMPNLAHLIVEVHPCQGHPCIDLRTQPEEVLPVRVG